MLPRYLNHTGDFQLNVMEQKEKPIDNIKSAIMAYLYCCLDPISLESGFVEALATGYPVEFGKIALNQLLLEELVKEKSGGFSLTPKGYRVIKKYGNYREYLNTLEKQRIDKGKEKQLDSKVKKSTILSNYLNATSAICSIIGFIAGVLSADQIKRILVWLLSTA